MRNSNRSTSGLTPCSLNDDDDDDDDDGVSDAGGIYLYVPFP